MPSRLRNPSGLVVLDATAKLAPAGPLPSRIVMLKWGVNDSAQGPIIVGDTTLAASEHWPAMGYGEVVVDFNHNTVPGHPSYKGEPCKVAANRATLSVIPEVGLVFDDIQWTPDGQANRDHYRDLSPAVKLDDSGEVLFCHSAAVCRNGAVHGLHLFSADTLTDAETAADFAALPLREKLIQFFGLDEGATDDDINETMETVLATMIEQQKDLCDESEDERMQDPAYAAAKKRATEEQLAQSNANRARIGLPPAPKIVGHPMIKTLAAELRSLTPEDREVMKRLGVTPAQWLKHNPPAPVRSIKALAASHASESAADLAKIQRRADEEVRKKMGISREAWDRFNP